MPRLRTISFSATLLICLSIGMACLHFWKNQPATASPLEKSPTRSSQRERLTEIHPDLNSPESLLAHGRRLLAADPADRNGRMGEYLRSLCEAGKFSTALLLIGDPSSQTHPDWVILIFTQWGREHPQEAINALNQLPNPANQGTAFRALADGWNAGDPAALATHAVSMQSGEDRDYALGIALDNWSLQDPAALSEWLTALPRGSEFDAGAAMMLAKSDSENCAPEVAVQWIENIQDPTLKQNSLLHVLKQWNEKDAAAAEHYLTQANWLDESQRQEIRSQLGRSTLTGTATD